MLALLYFPRSIRQLFVSCWRLIPRGSLSHEQDKYLPVCDNRYLLFADSGLALDHFVNFLWSRLWTTHREHVANRPFRAVAVLSERAENRP